MHILRLQMLSAEVKPLVRLGLFLLFLNATMLAGPQTSDERRRFVVLLPQQWQESKLRIVIEGVQIPGNVALKLRVTALGEDEKEVTLGSIGIEAIGPSKSELRSLRTVRIDVTRSLNRFLESKSNPGRIKLFIQPTDARNNPIRNLNWTVKSVRLEAQAK